MYITLSKMKKQEDKMKLSTSRATTTTRHKKRNYYMRYLSRKANKYCTKQTNKKKT